MDEGPDLEASEQDDSHPTTVRRTAALRRELVGSLPRPGKQEWSVDEAFSVEDDLGRMASLEADDFLKPVRTLVPTRRE